jgi:hypothetical protein
LSFQGGDAKNMIISDQIKAKWLDYWFGEFKKKYESIFDGIIKSQNLQPYLSWHNHKVLK